MAQFRAIDIVGEITVVGMLAKEAKERAARNCTELSDEEAKRMASERMRAWERCRLISALGERQIRKYAESKKINLLSSDFEAKELVED